MRKTILIFIACMFRACLSVMAQQAGSPPGVTQPQNTARIDGTSPGADVYLYYGSNKFSKINTFANFITSFGGNGNGSTDNTSAVLAARSGVGTQKPIHFPQNSTNNAVYYFANGLGLDGYYVSADPGVVLSVANTNGVNFANVKLLTPIRVYSRDRDNYGEQLANTNLPYDLLPIADRQTDEVLRNGIAINALNDFQKAAYDASTVVKINNGNSSIINNWQVNWFQNSIQTSASVDSLTFDVVEQNARLGKMYSATILTNAYAVGGKGGIMVWSANEWVFFGINNNGITLGAKKSGIPYAQISISPTSNAYKLNASSQPEVSARISAPNKIDFFINKHWVYTYTLISDAQTIGFGFNRTLNQLSYQSVYNPTSSDLPKSINGRAMRMLFSGNSITYGEGSAQTWPEYLRRYLIGKQGISEVTYNNIAVSGSTAAQQLVQLQAANLNGYDYIMVMLGTNDIQGQSNVFQFRNTLKQIGDLIRGHGAIPIVGIPPMFIDKAETLTGFETSNFDKGGYYRTAVKYIQDSLKIAVADVSAAMGEIGPNNMQLRDNIHPEQLFDTFIAQSFGNVIMYTLETPVIIEPGFKREGALTVSQGTAMPTKAGIAGDRVYNTTPVYGGMAGWINYGGTNWDGLPTQRYVFDHPERSRVTGIAASYNTGSGLEFSYNPADGGSGAIDPYDYGTGARTNLVLRGKNINFELYGGIVNIGGQNILDRAYHIGTQPASTISNFGSAVNDYVLNNSLTTYYPFLVNSYSTMNNPRLQVGDNNFGLGANNSTLYAFTVGDFQVRTTGTGTLADISARKLFSNSREVQTKLLYEYVPGINGIVNSTDSVTSAISKLQQQISLTGPALDPAGNEVLTNRITSKCSGVVGGNVFEKSPNGSWYWIHTDDDGSRLADPVTVSAGSQGEITVTLTAAPYTILSCTLP